MVNFRKIVVWMSGSWQRMAAVVLFVLLIGLFGCRTTGFFDFFGTMEEEQSQDSPIDIPTTQIPEE